MPFAVYLTLLSWLLVPASSPSRPKLVVVITVDQLRPDYLTRWKSQLTGGLGQLVSEGARSEEHTSELQSRLHLVCRLLLEKKKKKITRRIINNKNDTTRPAYESLISTLNNIRETVKLCTCNLTKITQ